MQFFIRRSENWGSAALLSLPVAIAVALLYGCNGRFVWPVALAVVGIPAVLETSRRMLVRRLQKRAAANDAMTWTVFVNDVMVAKIQDAQYAGAELNAWLAPSNYIAQASNFLRVALTTVGRVAVFTPLVLIWALAIDAVVNPQDIAYVFAHPGTLTTKDVASFGQLWTTLSLLSLIFTAVVLPFFGMKIGYVDHFKRDIDSRVRRLAGTPADGVIRLTPESTTQSAFATPPSAA
jgi:hypothetical protein